MIFQTTEYAPYKYVPPTWAGGTDAEIVEALEKHYAGEIDLTDYWSVGDERIVALSIEEDGETYYSPIVMVIMNVGGKTLVTPINGHTECAFIVGEKNIYYSAPIAPSNYSWGDGYGWNYCAARGWLNSTFRDWISSTLRSIFKQHYNATCAVWETDTPPDYYDKGIIQSADYFALPSLFEIVHDDSLDTTNLDEYNATTQFSWYADTTNIVKFDSEIGSGNECSWWTRTMSGYGGWWDVYINDFSNNDTYTNFGLSPFGVI